MITVIARWEDTQMPADVEYQMWRQLKGAYGIDRLIFTPVVETTFNVEQYDNMVIALLSADAEASRVFLEPSGYNPVGDIPQGDITLILGNTAMSNMEHARVDETYSIAAPAPAAHLYGINAAAIALAIRYGQ